MYWSSFLFSALSLVERANRSKLQQCPRFQNLRNRNAQGGGAYFMIEKPRALLQFAVVYSWCHWSLTNEKPEAKNEESG